MLTLAVKLAAPPVKVKFSLTAYSDPADVTVKSVTTPPVSFKTVNTSPVPAADPAL